MLSDMAFLESNLFCSAEEYRRDREKRVNEASIQPDQVYSLNALLLTDTREAAKLPVKLTVPIEHLVKVTFLSRELLPVSSFETAMFDGMMSIPKARIREADSDATHPIQEAFLKDYFEDQFGGFLEESFGLSVGAY